MIRHITSADNVRNGSVLDPRRIRHGVITAMRIADLSGWVDRTTHLNLDFPDHRLCSAVVAEHLEQGARVLEQEGRIVHAAVDPSAFLHFGSVDIAGRAGLLRQAVARGRDRQETGISG